MTRPLIALVTDARLYDDRMVSRLQQAARAGVDIIQIRERSFDDRRLVRLVADTVDAVGGTTARVVVNDRLDVALAAQAAGVHLPADGIDAGVLRTLAPEGFTIGRSVHSEEEAKAAERAGGCDYLLFGTVFPSKSKPPGHLAQGLAALARVCAAVSLPVLAIGGVDAGNARAIADAGASGVAAIRLFAGEDDLGPVVASLRAAFDRRSRVV